MKVIDLLNKIANDEEVPTKIKWNDYIYEKSKYNATPMGYYHRINGGIKLWFLNEINSLNDEVEIIEEDKKIDHIYHCCMEPSSEETKFLIQNINDLADKLNEIIDYLEEKQC